MQRAKKRVMCRRCRTQDWTSRFGCRSRFLRSEGNTVSMPRAKKRVMCRRCLTVLDEQIRMQKPFSSSRRQYRKYAEGEKTGYAPNMPFRRV
ncbi:MAG: hypothetical protein MJ177_00015 [Clostridia bacterium]|nr:hypothetical protein [Clostridia bacterium]